MSTYGKFYFRPMPGEQVSTELTPLEEEYAAICGRVLSRSGRPVSGAVVLLFLPGQEDAMSLVSRFVTDEDGHFVFGPLRGSTLYLIKVFKDELKLRELEVFTGEPD
ncbi:MAG: carboxypeptidase regulatory-like domain-containing protein [Clostridia bacterium]|nr:carboxypeptidase regulatory-like domain-containing protein [Clostridia bacterium]